jgi:hypothetical protein
MRLLRAENQANRRLLVGTQIAASDRTASSEGGCHAIFSMQPYRGMKKTIGFALQPPHSTRVGPRNTREVVIRTRAEEDEFIPYGFCRNN